MAVALPVAPKLLARFRGYLYGPLVALGILLALSAVFSPEFRQLQNLLNILRQQSYSGIVALGMTFVIVGGGIDLSVGSMMAWVGVLALATLNAAGGGPTAIALALLAALATGASFGFANGLIITKGRIAPFIVTLGSLSIFRSLTLWERDAGMLQSESEIYGRLGDSGLLGIPTPVWAWILLAFLLTLLLNNTRYGRHVCAVGSNEKVAQYSAIRVDRVRILTYVIVGAMVGVSAVLWTARLNSLSSAGFGKDVELDAIAAVIIGGTPMSGGRGSVWGTVVGAIILGIISNMLTMLGVSTYLQGTVKGLVIILAVFVQRKL